MVTGKVPLHHSAKDSCLYETNQRVRNHTLDLHNKRFGHLSLVFDGLHGSALDALTDSPSTIRHKFALYGKQTLNSSSDMADTL